MNNKKLNNINIFVLLIITVIALVLLFFVISLDMLSTTIMQAFVDKTYVENNDWILME